MLRRGRDRTTTPRPGPGRRDDPGGGRGGRGGGARPVRPPLPARPCPPGPVASPDPSARRTTSRPRPRAPRSSPSTRAVSVCRCCRSTISGATGRRSGACTNCVRRRGACGSWRRRRRGCSRAVSPADSCCRPGTPDRVHGVTPEGRSRPLRPEAGPRSTCGRYRARPFPRCPAPVHAHPALASASEARAASPNGPSAQSADARCRCLAVRDSAPYTAGTGVREDDLLDRPPGLLDSGVRALGQGLAHQRRGVLDPAPRNRGPRTRRRRVRLGAGRGRCRLATALRTGRTAGAQRRPCET